ncbi:hypothetical protein CDO44_24325 [Pigmentiphaga sp. NML080357]|uniref:iron transporter n=1 Tax=Pigmentiphaga sp. NML080357 TaxID=2008675 RepID=UPI000B40AE5C|nr:iron transporter [Pigmentiphaga sp. NML080357]OVZ55345.1 hypothetical protein CDO44_24325 [Pigmentiphaga sp. NML080357]
MSSSDRNPATARYRASIALRGAVAIAGGYALAVAVGKLAALALPLPRVDAVLAATMLAFVVYAWVALWAFRCASLARLSGVVAGFYGACLLLTHGLDWGAR